MNLAKHRVLFSLLVAVFILIAATVAIFWARGFKPNFRDGKIDRTGLIVVNSVPTGAEVYLDDRLTSATDTNIAFLEPKTYKLRVEKDGYTTWEKDIEVEADLAVEIKALLFPLAPEIKPLTNTGATNPTLSPDLTKIAYGVPGERGGLYILEMADGPLPFRQNQRLAVKNSAKFDFTKTKFIWGPDSKQLVAQFEQDNKVVANLLVEADRSNQDPRDVTGSLNSLLESWQDELILKSQNQAIIAPDSVKEATTEAKKVDSSQLTVDSKKSTSKPAQTTLNREPLTDNYLNYSPTGLNFSPDEEKILYKNKDDSPRGEAGKYKIYDLKLKREITLPDFGDLISINWFPDSNHLVVVQKDLIAIMEADGANKMTIYSGKFENGFVFAHPSGNRLIILTSLAQPDGTLPNLYSINLR